MLFRSMRRHMPTMFVVSILLNIGMFFERWMIVAPTLSLSHEPWQWDVMWGSIIEWALVFGSFGWFGLLFLLFVKVFPCVSMYEVKEMVFHRSMSAGERDVLRMTDHAKPVKQTPGVEGA